MAVLVIDTTGTDCAVLVRDNQHQVTQEIQPAARQQAEILVPMIDHLLAKASIVPTDIDHIIVTTGPGSFTGLRIGLATARGLGLGWSRHCIGIDNFTAYAGQINHDGPVAVILNSFRTELFIQIWHQGRAIAPPMMEKPALIADILTKNYPQHKNWRLVGNAAAQIAALWPTAFYSPSNDQLDLAELANLEILPEISLPRPFYVRPPDVTMAAKIQA